MKSWNTRYSLFVLAAFLCLFYAGGYFIIANYYAHHIPHYDSVGTYALGFNILDAIHTQGYVAASSLIISGNFSLSLLQLLFSYVFSPVLSKSEASFHLYNSLSIAWAFFAILIFSKRVGIRAQFAGLLCVLTLLPDGLYWWNLGVFDYRRDPACLFLLTASSFFMLGYFLGTREGRGYRLSGVLFGSSVGLTLISRDTAFGFVFGVVLLPALFFWVQSGLRNGWKKAMADLVWPMAGVAPLALLWFGSLSHILARILNPFVFNGGGVGAFVSFTDNASNLYKVWAANAINDNAYPWTFAILVLALGAGAFALSRQAVFPAAHAVGKEVVRKTAMTGLWGVVYVHLFLSFVVQWNTQEGIGEIASMAPYYYSLTGGYVLLAAGIMLLHVRGTNLFANVMLGVACAGILASGFLRAEGRKIELPQWQVDAHKFAAGLTAKNGEPAVFAPLWFDLNLPAIGLMASKQDLPAPRRILVKFDGTVLDMSVGAPASDDVKRRMKEAMKQTVLCESDYVITTTALEAYERKMHASYLYSEGRALVEEVNEALANVPHHVFGPDAFYPIDIIDNLDRVACTDKPEAKAAQ